MKWFLLLFLLALTTLSACKKERDNTSITALNGSWKMVKVKEQTNGSATTKPSSINGDVELTFSVRTDSTGTITGKTPTNILSGEFTTYAGQKIYIPAVLATKVMETTWGALFIDNVTSAQTYNVECNELRINTIKATLFFQKQ